MGIKLLNTVLITLLIYVYNRQNTLTVINYIFLIQIFGKP